MVQRVTFRRFVVGYLVAAVLIAGCMTIDLAEMLRFKPTVALPTDANPAKRFIWKLDRGRMVGILDLPESRMKRIEVQLSPMLGRVAVAPQGEEAFDGLWPGYFGGNMDASDVREGTTVYLPILHEGALFYFGDGHALQGDGQSCGSVLEARWAVSSQGVLSTRTSTIL